MAFLAPFLGAASGTAAAGTAAAGATTAGLSTAQMIALGLTVASGITSAYSGYQAGKAEESLRKFNAEYADIQAKDALTRGVADQDRIRLQLRKILGSQRARFGGGGIDPATGTPIDVALDSTRQGEQDMLIARNNAAREAFGFTTEAGRERYLGRVARKSSKLKALDTLLTSGAAAYGIYTGV